MALRNEHLTVQERSARGEQARVHAPTSSHGPWTSPVDRRDPVAVLVEQNLTRDADLVPVRHGRMMASPFTFYRGAAAIMASDLHGTPTAGLEVQLCGDAHLSNFGVFGSPERRLMFDVNDFDETLPGPFEYDVKRLAASITVAARSNGFDEAAAHGCTMAAVAAYREAMAGFAEMRTLDVWYASLPEEELTRAIQDATRTMARGKKGMGKKAKKQAREIEKRALKSTKKARSRDSLQALSKLAELVDGEYRITSVPPVIVPARDLAATYNMSRDEVEKAIREQFVSYRKTLQPDRRELLQRYQVVDVARKVVGVGSVGTRAFIVLLEGRDQADPLFLQVKEATSSVLEKHLRKSRYRQPGERVVQGQRMMQASSDIFLGWTRGVEADRYYYWRQLRDMKGSATVELMVPEALTFYAGICGWTLARAHARSGDPVAIAAYLGADDAFDLSVADFSRGYADQNEQDFQAFSDAVSTSRIEATHDV